MQLVGPTAIVTGGSKGIGYAIADRLMRHGADVVITSRGETEVLAAAERLTEAHEDAGRRAIGVAADAGVAADVQRTFTRAIEELGSVRILVNNAGNSTVDLIADMPEADFDSVLDTHLKGTFLATQQAIRHLRDSGLGGAIVNISSVEAVATTGGNAHYSAAKAGIDKLTEVSAVEAGKHGIRVNGVAPGVIETPLTQAHMSPAFEAAWRSTFSIDRMGRPDDIAKAVAFLASDQSDWITGITILVDGGTHLRGVPDYVAFMPGRAAGAPA